LGFRKAALTFLNQPAVVAGVDAGLGSMWEANSRNGRGNLTDSCSIAGITRYSVKGAFPQRMLPVTLTAGATGFDTAEPRWFPTWRVQILRRNEHLAARPSELFSLPRLRGRELSATEN